MYDHKEIEKKWQDLWNKEDSFNTDINSTKQKYYVLDMFPYPSGSGLHVGHPEGYTATDIVARFKRFKGFEVLHPMGFDAFGLPAEQYAIQTGNSPKEFTEKNIQTFKKQLKSLGFSFDWKREINTTDPEYFKTTQWIFAQLFKHNLAELKDIEVNWSTSLNTVLSNEEIIEQEDGSFVSERDEKPVIKKNMKQWVLNITKYADKLVEGLDNVDWPEGLKNLQRNWIYKTDEETGKKILHLRDWVFARQRYWGEPFPIIHLENGEIYLIPEMEYPVKLPELDNFEFSQDGEPALSKATEWSKVEVDGVKGVRDLNTMPQWAGSCWYYMGYILKDGDTFLDIESPEAKIRLDNWLPVDLYVGGQEHAVLHLMYARFWHIFLSEIGITTKKEPFQKIYNQGMILGEDGKKMSKSKGNVINPDVIVEEYGADTLRVYLMFMGPLNDDKPWTSSGVQASRAWLDRVHRLMTTKIEFGKPSEQTKQAFNKLLVDVDDYYENLKFNMAISSMMIFVNHLYKDNVVDKKIVKTFLQLLSCIAPHISEEIIQLVCASAPKTITSKEIDLNQYEIDAVEITIEIPIQVNGKTKNVISIPSSKILTKDELVEIIESDDKYSIYATDAKKVIYVEMKVINFIK